MRPRSAVVWPGPGRITLALLAAVPAAMAYPWESVRDRWLLGIAVAVVILLFGQWRGLYFTTFLRRRLAMLRPDRRLDHASPTDVRTTALLRVNPPAAGPDRLPLTLVTKYLDCYGIRADAIRVISRDTAPKGETPRRETWIGLTISAADNLAALRARSPRIPLHETAEVAVRRLADHLREHGWTAAVAEPDDIPMLFAPSARETWRGVWEGTAGYVAAYRITADDELPDTLAAIQSYSAQEAWTALEIAGADRGRTIAVACALRTEKRPGRTAPLSGLTPHSGHHRPALIALDPLAAQRLDGHTELPADLLARLRWPATTTAAVRASPATTTPVPAPSRPRHAAASRN